MTIKAKVDREQGKRFAGFFDENKEHKSEQPQVPIETVVPQPKEKTTYVTLRVSRATWLRMKKFQVESGSEMNLTEIMEDALNRYLPDK